MAEIEIIGCMDHTMDHTFESANRVYGENGICPTIPTSSGGGGHMPKIIDRKKIDEQSVLEEWIWEIDGEVYLIRIRKLTPRECWRLMGFTDQDFDKAQNVCSNTQLYKQAGNSIVAPVLEALFKQMF